MNLPADNTGTPVDARLQIHAAHGETTTFTLRSNQTVFAGTSQACGIVLSGPGIAPFHVVFSYIDGQLLLQGCSSDCHAQIQGVLTSEETRLRDGEEIAIGENRIVPLLRSESAPDESTLQPAEQPNAPTGPTADSAETPSEVVHDVAPAGDFAETADRDDSVHTENPAWAATETPDQGDAVHVPFPETFLAADEDFDTTATREELELLRSEVEFLQSELAQRNEQLAQREANGAVAADASADVGETEKLVCRLEELLAELQSSDQKIRLLEDHLRASDEANRAEQEERRQLEKWLEDVENRMSLRTEEAEAELERVRQRLDQERQHREHAEQQVAKLMQPQKAPAETPASSQELQRAQEQLVQKSRQAETLESEKAELLHQLSALRVSDAGAELQDLRQKMVTTELEISRERAELAREKANLERLRCELEFKNRETTDDEKDAHLVAMRQHLREIHEEEKLAAIERKKNSLSGRITNLLTRKYSN